MLSAVLLQETRALVRVLWSYNFWALNFFGGALMTLVALQLKTTWYKSAEDLLIPSPPPRGWNVCGYMVEITADAGGRLRGSFKSWHRINAKFGKQFNFLYIKYINTFVQIRYASSFWSKYSECCFPHVDKRFSLDFLSLFFLKCSLCH